MGNQADCKRCNNRGTYWGCRAKIGDKICGRINRELRDTTPVYLQAPQN